MSDGQSAGSVSLDQARYLAHQYDLDLVEIGSGANPPIVKLLDYNKYRYQQEKHARGVAKVKNELKEMRLSFSINAHDIATKAKRAKEFLDDGNFVRVYINLRGRENAFPDKAKKTLEDFATQVDGQIEQPVNQAGKKIQLIIKSKKKS
jgi:translation initiation factor IF-3